MKALPPDYPATTHVEDPGTGQGVDRRFAMCGLDFPRPLSGGEGWWTVRGRRMQRLLTYEHLRPHRMSMSEVDVPPPEKVTCIECQEAYVGYRLTKGSFL